MKMKNDLSFLIDSHLSLYEHQSTWNPNMPLRGLFYFAQQYEGLAGAKGADVYGKTRISLPTPEYIVFGLSRTWNLGRAVKRRFSQPWIIV